MTYELGDRVVRYAHRVGGTHSFDDKDRDPNMSPPIGTYGVITKVDNGPKYGDDWPNYWVHWDVGGDEPCYAIELAHADVPDEQHNKPSTPAKKAALRKMQPVGSIIRDYFPDALRAVAAVAWVGNEKHNPGEPLHWARGKSDDHHNALARHLIDSEGWNTEELKDGRVFQVLHAANLAWRALAYLQLVVERENGEVIQVVNDPNFDKLA